jgi:trehalose-6-phosphate synthase
MRISQRLIISMVLAVSAVTFLFARVQVRREKQALRDDLNLRAEVLADSLEETIQPALADGSYPRGTQRMVDRFEKRGGVLGIAFYDSSGSLRIASAGLDRSQIASPPAVFAVLRDHAGIGSFFWLGSDYTLIYTVPLLRGQETEGALAVFDDANYIVQESGRIWRDAVIRVLVQVVLIVFITLLVIRLSFHGPVLRLAQWMKQMRSGESVPHFQLPEEEVFQPIAREVANMARSLAAARSTAHAEAQLRDAGESLWTAERLRVHVESKLHGSRLFAVSNREPYEHVNINGKIEVVVPASGLVTALEPILRACNGTWIASASGNADREVVDSHDRVRVPPDQPQYMLRRVWLTEEEMQGYYYGFANEGLWPLCHIAHTRPHFRAQDWQAYQAVNSKFAAATLEEINGDENPIVLLNDYHLAILPKLIKARRPDARVAIFWHIPWPNPEAFGICPWQRELLEGLLAADLIGFHIQAHCNNFLETVDGVLESRCEWERFGVSYGGHFTAVKPFPISVDSGPSHPVKDHPVMDGQPPPQFSRAAVLRKFGADAPYIGVGVDRADYTKGIVERFRGIECFLRKYPMYRGQFTFVQIAAPSRTSIPRYQDFQQEIAAEAKRINDLYQTGNWRPIVLIGRHHAHHELEELYRAADLCMVTSLHDGMNLVAKEFVAARHDQQGALILSRFTGAAQELQDALIVNPYDEDQVAEAIRAAIEMDPEERSSRMRRMRASVKEHNIFHWAGSLVATLSELRVAAPEPLVLQ